MTVYFEPRRGNGWLDFAGLAAGKLLGGVIDNHFEGKRQQREFDYLQQAADAEIARRQADEDRAMKLLLGDQGFGNLNMREDPDRAMYEMAAIKALVGDFDTTGALNNLNAPMQFQTADKSDRIEYGTLDPSTGRTNMRESTKGINPDVQLQSDTSKYVADAGVRTAGINAGARMNAPVSMEQFTLHQPSHR